MAIELKMPALSPTMEKGTLAKWLVAEGDLVKAGDLVAEIETDKATMEMEANDEGRIARLVVAEGTDNVAVGTIIALLAEANEPAVALAVEKPAVATPHPVAPAPTSAPVSSVAVPSPQQPVPQAVPPHRVPSAADPVKASPLARRLADVKGINLASIVGSGPKGRIVLADLGIASPVLQAPAPAVAAAPVAVIAPPPAGVPLETVKLSSMRRTIARRLSESKQTVPHFYLTVRCNLDPLLALRGELNDTLATRGIKLSVNDMLIKVLALALLQVPDANVQFGGDVLHRFARADISVAVAIAGGLITPVITDAGRLPLSVIAQRSKLLVQKARDGKLLPEEYQGGTASISNLGMFGVDQMFPVINLPQALILGIGAGVEQPWKVNGEIGLATLMSATASFDHRAIDGAVAAEFMAALRNLIESPLLIVS